MPYSTIIFDIDGTLTDSAPAILYSLRNALLATIGKDYSYEELHSALAAPSTSPSRNLPATGGKKRHISVRPTIWKPSTKYLCSLTWKKQSLIYIKKALVLEL